jgi:hypothetical protein
MARPLSTLKPEFAASRAQSALRWALVWGGAGLGTLLVAGAAALWLHYGTAVFFETIAAGFANCF